MDEYNNGQYNAPYYSERPTGFNAQLALQNTLVKSLLMAAGGVLLSTLTAILFARSELFMFRLIMNGPQILIAIVIAEFVLVFADTWAINKGYTAAAVAMYFMYALLNGFVLSIVFFAYGLGTAYQALLMTTLMFAGICAFGYFTKRDLSKVGSIAIMALWGVIVVSFLNLIWFKSTGLDLVMDYVVVLLFVAITAWDFQKAKKVAMNTGGTEGTLTAVSLGMELYLDFINLLIRLISIMGRRRD